MHIGTGMREVFIGWDSREQVASEVASYSIKRRAKHPVKINFLKHKDLRLSGHFCREWLIEGRTGNFRDLTDDKNFSTEFSHTRFLVPALKNYKGWALFMDADMLFLTDIHKLFDLCDDKYAVMCVKHNHRPKTYTKMDKQPQSVYERKNWSSFVLWNCAHPANEWLTIDRVNQMKGSDLHQFSWLSDSLIGELPYSYNFIHGVSPPLPIAGHRPDVVHYTEGGPWFDNCRDVKYAQVWLDEYEDFQREQEYVCHVPTMAYDRRDK